MHSVMRQWHGYRSVNRPSHSVNLPDERCSAGLNSRSARVVHSFDFWSSYPEFDSFDRDIACPYCVDERPAHIHGQRLLVQGVPIPHT